MSQLPVPMTAPQGSGERLLWAIGEWGGGRVPILLYLARVGGRSTASDLLREFVGVTQSTVLQQVAQMRAERFLLDEEGETVTLDLEAIRRLSDFVLALATGAEVSRLDPVDVELEARRWWRRPRGTRWVAPHCLAFARELRRLL